jgi:hypothetical protein
MTAHCVTSHAAAFARPDRPWGVSSAARAVAGGCGVLATIDDPVVIRKILVHLGLPTEVPAPRPTLRAPQGHRMMFDPARGRPSLPLSLSHIVRPDRTPGSRTPRKPDRHDLELDCFMTASDIDVQLTPAPVTTQSESVMSIPATLDVTAQTAR